jgi:KaiC/GvpD/RAD55 family RecA-like ATPase
MTSAADAAMRPGAPNPLEQLFEVRRGVDEIEAKISRGAATKARAQRVWIEQAELPAPGQWLVKGLIGARDLVLVYGQTSCGKTFWTIDLVASIAAELQWRRRRTKRALVVYVAAEAGQTIMRRFIAWRDRNVGDAREQDVPLAIIPRAFNLLEPLDVATLMRQLRELAAERGEGLGLVVIDTLSRSMAGGDENSAADMTRAIATADLIRDELACAVLLIHHSGKDAARGARGHSALASAADTVVSVADRVALFEKVRDGAANISFPFDLEVVELGRDEDGEAITTCVAVASDEPPLIGTPRPARGAAGLGANQDKALSTLRRMLSAKRKYLTESGRDPDDPDEAFVLLAGWRTACEEKAKIDRKRWSEVLAGLRDRGFVRIDGERAIPLDALS